jgi:hypothetical protein
MKKIVSFCLWGKNTFYTDGAVWNAQNVRNFYPDWSCRFYHDSSVPKKVLKELEKAGSELVLKSKTTEGLGMFWRFEPMFDDPEVSRFIVRDTDSKFSNREVDLVNQWIETTKPFHIVRDCESHGTSILGGTWGAVPGCIDNFELKISSFISQVIPDTKNPRGPFHGADQIFLHHYIWPLIKDNHCAHIRTGCKNLRYTEQDIEIPDPEDGHYVGMVA